jgi:hypothetical protein
MTGEALSVTLMSRKTFTHFSYMTLRERAENPGPNWEATAHAHAPVLFRLLRLCNRRGRGIAAEVELALGKMQRRAQLKFEAGSRRKIDLFAAPGHYPDGAGCGACGASNAQPSKRMAARDSRNGADFSAGDGGLGHFTRVLAFGGLAFDLALFAVEAFLAASCE